MATRRIGNTSASSLVRTATAAYNRTQTYNDSVKAYEFEQSDKSEADYKTYTDYLAKRASQVTDPSQQLSFTKAQDSAFKGFKSSQIQKASLAVNYGTGSLYDKRNTLDNLWQQAMSIGDQSTAQSLELQRSNLDIQITNHEQAAANAASGGGRGGGGGGSTYETQSGIDAEKRYSDMNVISDHLKSQLDQHKISFADYSTMMAKVSMGTNELTDKINAEAEARAKHTTTGDPEVANMSSSDLSAVLKKADSYTNSSDYYKNSPEALQRMGYGMFDKAITYENGVQKLVDRHVSAEYNATDDKGNKYVAHEYDKGIQGNKFEYDSNADQSNHELAPHEAQLYDHLHGQPTKYKYYQDADGTMRAVASLKDPQTGQMHTVSVDMSKPADMAWLDNQFNSTQLRDAATPSSWGILGGIPYGEGAYQLGQHSGFLKAPGSPLNLNNPLASELGHLTEPLTNETAKLYKVGSKDGASAVFKTIGSDAGHFVDGLVHPPKSKGSFLDALTSKIPGSAMFHHMGTNNTVTNMVGSAYKTFQDKLAQQQAADLAQKTEAARIAQQNHNLALQQAAAAQAKATYTAQHFVAPAAPAAPAYAPNSNPVQGSTPEARTMSNIGSMFNSVGIAKNPAPAPAPQPFYKTGALGAIGNFTHLW